MSALRVHEVIVSLYSAPAAREWWTLFRLHGPEARITTVTVGFPGDVVDVACDDRDHADWLRRHMIDQGIPPRALEVVPDGR